MSRLKCDCCGDKFQNDDEFEEHLDHEPNAMLSGSIVSSAVFIGSAFLFQTNETLGIAGMLASIAQICCLHQIWKITPRWTKRE